MSLIFSLGMTILGEVSLPFILSGLQTPPEIRGLALDFLSIYLIGYVADFLFLYFAAVLRSHGNTLLQALVILLSTITNAVLDPFLIMALGFNGAAIATLISKTIAAIILVVYLLRKRLFTFRIKAFDGALLPSIGKTALPAIIQQSIPALSTSFLVAIVSTFDISSIAAYGIAGKVETILLYPAMAFNMVLTSIVGQCIGSRRFDRAKDYVKCAFLYGAPLFYCCRRS